LRVTPQNTNRLIISFLEKVCSKGSKVFFREPKQ
jgi:hypothetical protein